MLKISKMLLLGCILFFMGKENLRAQTGMVGQEIGLVVGPVAYYTDYGLRWNLETNTSNTGIGVGLVYYLNFAYRADCHCYTTYSYFNDHFKVRAEIDYHQGDLNHYGPISKKNNLRGEQLRAMIAQAQVFEIGAHLEYYPLSIRDYTAFAYPISPFASLGFNFVGFTPRTYSTLGSPLEDHLIDEFKGGVDITGGSTWSVVLGLGARYRLHVMGDLVLNLQWRYYDTDLLDGLDHDNPQNKFNDMIFWLNVGYIYYINF